VAGLPTGLAPHRATYDALVCARLLVRLAMPDDAEPLALADLLTTVEQAPTLF
jgi:exodeoxyribonuclease X